MKLRIIIIITLAALLLAACNMTLAQDVTPPPGYVQPTPVPTLGPLYPDVAPDVANGALIYAEKCAACHGDTGLGDGEQGKQLPVPVAALGLPEIAYEASPASWFLTVSLGNLERFMPPFNSLTDAQRWDVVAYSFTLSTTPEQVEDGEVLYAQFCLECHGDQPDFVTQEKMAAFSPENLDFIIENGIQGTGMPAMSDSLSESDRAAINAYLRTLTFSEPATTDVATVEPSATQVPPASGGTEVPPEETAVSAAVGQVSGMLVNGTGNQIPADTLITLRGFSHSTDPNSTPQEVVTETALVSPDGSYVLEDIQLEEGLIFLAQLEYSGITYQSDLAFVESGATGIVIPDLTIYETTTETGALVVEQLHISFDFAVEDGVQVFEVFTIRNLSNKTILVESDGSFIPFMPMPAGVSEIGYELSQESARLLPTEDGFALPPAEELYGIVAFFNMPFEKELDFSQSLALSVDSILVIVPEGIQLEGDLFTDEGLQTGAQGSNFQIYTGQARNAGESIDIQVSGKVGAPGVVGDLENRQLVLIAAGALGLTLIIAGGWMFVRDRKREDRENEHEEVGEDGEDGEDDEAEFDRAEEVMDAIIALDDLFRAKKISEQAYHERRDELKEILRELA
jgi:mono/diheme cytochrome c family protein